MLALVAGTVAGLAVCYERGLLDVVRVGILIEHIDDNMLSHFKCAFRSQ